MRVERRARSTENQMHPVRNAGIGRDRKGKNASKPRRGSKASMTPSDGKADDGNAASNILVSQSLPYHAGGSLFSTIRKNHSRSQNIRNPNRTSVLAYFAVPRSMMFTPNTKSMHICHSCFPFGEARTATLAMMVQWCLSRSQCE